MNATAVAIAPTGPVKATWVCLILAWVLFLIPVPGVGMFVGWPLNLVAFILAIVVMTKGRTAPGLIPLLCSIVVSPIVYFIGLAIFGAAVVGASNTSATAQTATTAETAIVGEAATTAVPAIAVTAHKLYADYQANEVAADGIYKNKSLAVSGTVEGIKKDAFDKVYVELSSGEFMSVNARDIPEATATMMSKGQSVTVNCTGNGLMISSPQLADCTVAE